MEKNFDQKEASAVAKLAESKCFDHSKPMKKIHFQKKTKRTMKSFNKFSYKNTKKRKRVFSKKKKRASTKRIKNAEGFSIL